MFRKPETRKRKRGRDLPMQHLGENNTYETLWNGFKEALTIRLLDSLAGETKENCELLQSFLMEMENSEQKLLGLSKSNRSLFIYNLLEDVHHE